MELCTALVTAANLRRGAPASAAAEPAGDGGLESGMAPPPSLTIARTTVGVTVRLNPTDPTSVALASHVAAAAAAAHAVGPFEVLVRSPMPSRAHSCASFVTASGQESVVVIRARTQGCRLEERHAAGAAVASLTADAPPKVVLAAYGVAPDFHVVRVRRPPGPANASSLLGLTQDGVQRIIRVCSERRSMQRAGPLWRSAGCPTSASRRTATSWSPTATAECQRSTLLRPPGRSTGDRGHGISGPRLRSSSKASPG